MAPLLPFLIGWRSLRCQKLHEPIRGYMSGTFYAIWQSSLTQVKIKINHLCLHVGIFKLQYRLHCAHKYYCFKSYFFCLCVQVQLFFLNTIESTLLVKNLETLVCISPSPMLIWLLQSSRSALKYTWLNIREGEGPFRREQRCEEWM